jgi:hypothetical protein
MSFLWVSQKGNIPTTTRSISVHIGADMDASIPVGNQTNECYIDRVEFYIFKQLNGIQHSYFQKYSLIFSYFPLSFVDSTDNYNRKLKAVNQTKNRPIYLLKKRQIQSTSPNSCASAIDFLSQLKNKFMCFI